MIYNHFLYWILGKSFTASLLIIIILLFKFLFRDKLSPKWHYYIWLLVLVQLVTPYAIESRFNLSNVQNYIPGYEWFDNKTHISDSLHFDTIDSVRSMDGNENANHSTTLDYNIENEADAKQSKEDRFSSMIPLVSYIWLLGVFILLAYNSMVYYSLSRTLKKGKPVDSKVIIEVIEASKLCMNLKAELQVIETTIIRSPSIVGVVKPKLLLPPGFYAKLTEDEFKCVVYHELSHIKRNDLVIRWLMKVFLVIHWFNPLLWYGFYRMSEDIEIACDAYSLSFIETEKHNNYGHTIIKLLELFSQTNPIYPVVGMTRSKLNIKRRIESIKGFGKPSNIIIMGAITLLLVLSSFLIKNPLKYSAVQDIKPLNQNSAYVPNDEEYSKKLQEASAEISEKIKEIMNNSTQGLKQGNNLQMEWPVPNSGLIAAPFGKRLYQKEMLMHPGLDILSKTKADVIAAKDGEVIYAGYYSAYGLTVIINHGNKIATVYSQLSEISVENKEYVKAGTKIGEVGNTGYSYEPHLHFELRKDGEPVNPLTEYRRNASAQQDSPGLTIIMEENNSTEIKAGLEGLANKIVNELLFAGAVGIYINDEPITLESQIRCVGPTLKINDKIMALPYTIKAVGESQKLSLLFEEQQIMDEAKKAGVELSITAQ